MVTENVPTGELVSAIILVILTGFLSSKFISKRRSSQVNALDWLISIFVSTCIMGILQILKLFFVNDWAFFKHASDVHSLPVDPVRFFHLTTLLILFFMSEQFLTDNVSSIRTNVMTAILALYFGLSIYYISTNQIIYFDEIFGFAQTVTLDSFLFDLIQLYVAGSLVYVYYEQYRVTESRQIESFLRILLIALGIFFLASLSELFEAFVEGFALSGFLTAIPIFLIIAYFYLKNPNFVYLAPSKIQFLQIVSNNGELLYAAELKDEFNSNDFLIAPSLTSVNTMLGELVGKDDLQMNKFAYNGGNILFEQVGNVQIILQTDRPAGILKRSMKYFLQVFTREFESQIADFRGSVTVNDKNISPDDVLRQCIPIVQSKALTSSYHVEDRTEETSGNKE